MWRATVQLLAIWQILQKTISTASRRQMTNKVPEYQKMFQEDNGIPVQLKGGTMDTLLYWTTMLLTIFVMGYTLYELLMAAMPKKSQ
uniref:Cytochrome c oxidase subunit 7A2, mitochondrial n=1 Tax=Salvator merianae TaxID=96440 RepID=A0A8D0KKJ8_SALMN